ncbi:sugar ABC transporter permease [Cnuibacter physcomitrellae]|nr:sugar ABC transporter permease [Cnuibacter physcomitrellae]
MTTIDDATPTAGGATGAAGPGGPRPAPTRRRIGSRTLAGTSILYAILVVVAIVYIFPFLINIATSFKTDAEAASDPLSLIPQIWTTAAYERLFLNSDFPTWFMNSAIVTVFVTIGRVFLDSLAGYALARLHFRGRGIVFAGLVAVMAVPLVVLLIPKFLVINQLGMYDSYAGMIIPLLVDAAGVFIMKNFFESIPASVEEQARIDGAGTFRIFWSVVLPMARPALITIIILSFQGSWNELSHFIISTQSPELTTLTKGVASLASGQLSQGTQYPLKLAAALIMTVPVAVMFFVFQRRIMNASEGAVKE